jgi:hypothetical protein
MAFIFFTLLLCQHIRSSLNDVQASVAKRGVINDWLNDRFGSTANNQIFQCSGLFVEQTSHISLNGVRPLMPWKGL